MVTSNWISEKPSKVSWLIAALRNNGCPSSHLLRGIRLLSNLQNRGKVALLTMDASPQPSSVCNALEEFFHTEF
jgi:hypothetical protein